MFNNISNLFCADPNLFLLIVFFMSFIEIMIVGEIMALPDGVFLSSGGIILLAFVVMSFSTLITESSPEYLD